MKHFTIRAISVSVATSILVAVCTSNVFASTSNDNNVITPRLSAVMNEMTDSTTDKIPVQIQLKDTVDYDDVESQAMDSANLTDQELNYIYSEEFAELADTDLAQMTELENKYETYREARIDGICEQIANINQPFVDKYDLKAESISLSLPDINLVYLTIDEINEIAYDTEVETIDFVELKEAYPCGYSMASVDSCVRSNTARSYGWDGTGVKVGVVELGWANKNKVGSKLTNVGGPTSGTDDHATFVSGEINYIVPGADIYLRKADTNSITDVLDAVEYLMTVSKVQVINMSLEYNSDGQYDNYSRRLDNLVRQNKITVVVAAGNISDSSNTYVSGFGLAPNVITVGSVNHNGATTATSSTYTFSTFSRYSEASGVINKPDVCAPGENLDIYDYTGWSGTSMATPIVTAIVAQMIDRNVGMAETPQTLKAAVMASCYYNAGTTFNNNISDKEGAGVVDGNFTYRVARNGRRWHFDFTPSGVTEQTYQIYADYNNKDFRVSIAWESEIISNQNELTDYDLYIYKGDTLVTASTGTRNNEVIVIPAATVAQYGAGYYTAKIKRFGSANTTSDRVGLAWEQ